MYMYTNKYYYYYYYYYYVVVASERGFYLSITMANCSTKIAKNIVFALFENALHL